MGSDVLVHHAVGAVVVLFCILLLQSGSSAPRSSVENLRYCNSFSVLGTSEENVQTEQVITTLFCSETSVKKLCF